MASPETAAKQRVPAAERRNALIDAGIHEFAQAGYHGTPVDRIARAVKVAQPYVFTLFGGKRELFLATVERSFEITGDTFEAAAQDADPALADQGEARLMAMGQSYYMLMAANPDLLMLQLHAYAACGDPEIRKRVAAATGCG
jgi:AcrR family transcriptional regulator